MAFWSRLRQSKLKFHLCSNDKKKCYTLSYHPILAAHQYTRSRTLLPVLNNPNCIAHGSLSDFYCNVRFYAAPIQANQKKEERDTSGARLNENITAPSVRLVTDEGHFVVLRYEALTRAKNLKLDLVEVDRHARPPVCKIFDYHKEKYVQQTKEKERSKSKNTLKKGGFKEVRFAAKIKPKDLQIKADMVKRLMESGHRVKCTAIEPTEDMDLESLLSRFSALIEDVAVEETGPQIEKKQAYIVVRHVKFGPPKKAGKKASKAAVSSNTGAQSSKFQPFQENSATIADSSETTDDLLDDEIHATKSEWAVFDGGDVTHPFFDINDEESKLRRSYKNDQSAAVSGLSPYFEDGNSRRGVESAATIAPSSPSLGVNRYARDPPSFGIPNHGTENRYTRDPPSFGVPNQAKENRYASDPRPERPSRIPTGTGGNGAGNRVNGMPQFSSQGRQQQFTSPQIPQSQQDTSGSGPPNRPPKSYGVFSSGNSNPIGHERNVPPETNRYKKNDPSVRNPNTTGAPPMRNTPRPRAPGFDNPRHGR